MIPSPESGDVTLEPAQPNENRTDHIGIFPGSGGGERFLFRCDFPELAAQLGSAFFQRGGPGGEGGMMSGPESNLPPSPADITEVKQIRLVGYTLIMGANPLEQEFQKRLKDSTFFSDADDGSVLVKYAPETDTLNLSSFEMLVKLKEPIKK